MQCLFRFRRGHQQPAGPAEPHHQHVSREREAEVRSEAHPAAEAESSVRPVQDAHRNRWVFLSDLHNYLVKNKTHKEREMVLKPVSVCHGPIKGCRTGKAWHGTGQLTRRKPSVCSLWRWAPLSLLSGTRSRLRACKYNLFIHWFSSDVQNDFYHLAFTTIP